MNNQSYDEIYQSVISELEASGEGGRESLLDFLKYCVAAALPEYDIVAYSDYRESDSNMSYKHLYEKLTTSNSNLDTESKHLSLQLDMQEAELAQLKSKLKEQIEINRQFRSSVTEIIAFVKEQMEAEVMIVSDVKAVDQSGAEVVCSSDGRGDIVSANLALSPGVYDFKRPAWFTYLKTELSSENIALKNAAAAKGELRRHLDFWAGRLGKKSGGAKLTAEQKADIYDNERRERIVALCNSNVSNEEKYIKYILLTPGLPKDYLHTLNSAAKLNLDAKLIIEFLEQPEISFNKEIIETFVSEVHKGADFNIKKELAEELMRGEWYVTADVNGKPQKFQLMPYELVSGIKKKIDLILDTLNNPYTIDETVNDEPIKNAGYNLVPNRHKVENEPSENTDVKTDGDETLRQVGTKFEELNPDPASLGVVLADDSDDDIVEEDFDEALLTEIE